MNFLELSDPDVFQWIILPLLIFLARVIDVSIGTVRVIFISRGVRFLAPIFGFFEILIWLLAIGQIMQNLTNWMAYIAYAGGFAVGTFVGMVIENRLSIGIVGLRIVTSGNISELIENLEARSYGITLLEGRGARDNVKIMFSIIRRYDINTIVAIVRNTNPNAFYWIEDIRYVNQGIFPPRKSRQERHHLKALRSVRKGK